MATKKRKIDWPQVALLSVAALCVTYLVSHMNPDRAEAWIALGPGVVAVIAAFRRPVVEKDGES